MKAADKLSAHIKCLEELKAGNLEFRRAAEQTEQALDDFHLPELTYFREQMCIRDRGCTAAAESRYQQQ